MSWRAPAARPSASTRITAHPDWTVWDPAQIWGGSAAALKEAVAKLPDPKAIAGVAVTGMGMDGVPVDGDGKWLYPFISWLCPRTEPQLQWWEKNIGAEKNFSIGGNTVWRYSTALRLLWMAENEPEILARTKKWLLIEDFLNFMLSGVRGHRLQHGLLHPALRPEEARVVEGDARPLEDRRAAAVRRAAQRHRYRGGHGRGRRGHGPPGGTPGGPRRPRLPLRSACPSARWPPGSCWT